MEEKKSLTTVKNEKQELALELMLIGQTDTEIAKTLGVTRQTLYNWRNLDARFMNALAERQALMREMAQNGLLELTEGALEAIREALKDKDNRVRLQAARLVLDMLKVNKPEERKEPSVIDLLYEALVGVEDKLGIGPGDKPIDISQK